MAPGLFSSRKTIFIRQKFNVGLKIPQDSLGRESVLSIDMTRPLPGLTVRLEAGLVEAIWYLIVVSPGNSLIRKGMIMLF